MSGRALPSGSPSNCMPTSSFSGNSSRALEEHQRGVVVAEGMLGLQVQLRLETGLLAGSASSTLGSRSSPPKKNSTGSASSSIRLPRVSSSVQVRVTTQGALICIAAMIAHGHRACRFVATMRAWTRRFAAAARRLVAGAVHAPPLAEEAAAGAPGLARCGAAAAARGAVRAGGERGRRVAPARARAPSAGRCATARCRGARCRR